MRSTIPVRKVVVGFPEPLFRWTEQVASQLSTNRSHLIRCAVEEYLRLQKRRALEAELASACEANADLGRRLCDEFSHVDAEIA